MLPSTFKAIRTPTDLSNGAFGGAFMDARVRRCGSSFTGNAEPSLAEVMGDPIVRGLMARDGVLPESLQGLIDEIRGRLR